MTRRSYFGPALAIWLAVEMLAFVAVAQAIGVGGAILIGLGTSLLGFSLLRENTMATFAQVRAAFAAETSQTGSRGGPKLPDGVLAEGLIGALGALLLILPGFVSDLVGLAMTTPSVRKALADRVRSEDPLAPRRRDVPPGVIDLNPGEWRASDSSSERRPR